MKITTLIHLTLISSLLALPHLQAEHPKKTEHLSKSEHPSKAEHPSKSEHPAKSDKASHAQAELWAVAFHADWCGTCKMLSPKMAEVRPSLDGHPIQFKKMDLTNEATTAEAKKLAVELGISKLFEANDGKTGYIVLLDPDTKQPVGKVGASMTVPEIKGQFKLSLAKAKAGVSSQGEPEHPKKSEHPSKSEHPR